MTPFKEAEQQAEKKKKKRRQQADLDSILDAALDELLEDDEDSDCNNNNNNRCNSSSDGDDEKIPLPWLKNQNVGDDCDVPPRPDESTAAETVTKVTTGVPYSLEYLANNPQAKTAAAMSTNNTRGRASRENRRPKFGPEPPPPEPPAIFNQDCEDSLSAEEINLAATLENMMKQFASGLNSNNGNGNNDVTDANMAELQQAERALEEMFKKMMMMEEEHRNNNNDAAVPSSPTNGTAAAASRGGGQSKKKKSSSRKSNSSTNVNNNGDSGRSSSSSSSSSNNNFKTDSSEKRKNEINNEPNDENEVDESINRLLDGINQASSFSTTFLQEQNGGGGGSTTMPIIPPTLDPSQIEHLSEQMMGSLMKDFEQLNTSQDSNDVVDNVMKQLLDKDLMYEPMKEVCTRFPAWLATNKDRLSYDEYQKYGTQYQYFQRIVRLYETDPYNFDRLMELMQDIQEYGQPPVEIIKELAPDLQFDEEGMPVVMDGGGMMMPGMPFPMGGPNNGEQCCIS